MEGSCIGGTLSAHDCFNLDLDLYKDFNFSSFSPGEDTRCNVFRYVYAKTSNANCLVFSSKPDCVAGVYDLLGGSTPYPWAAASNKVINFDWLPASFCCKQFDGSTESNYNC